MPLRFIFTLGLLLLGGLYLLPNNTEDVRLTLWGGREYGVPLILVVLGFALIGALGTAIWDLPSRATTALRRGRQGRAKQRLQEAETFYQAGQASLTEGNHQAARRAFRRSLRRNPIHKLALLELGNLHRSQGNLDAAFNLHKKAIQAGNKDQRLIESLADDFASAGRPDALRALLERVRYTGGDETIPLTRIRDYYVSAGAWEIATGFQKKLVQRKGAANNPDRMLLAHLIYETGCRSLQAGKLIDAENHFKEATEVHAECIPPRVALGDVYCSSNRNVQALKIWCSGYENTRASIFLVRILSMFDSGSLGEDSIQSLRRVQRKSSDDNHLQLTLAEVFLRLDQPSQALQYLSEDPTKDTEQARLIRTRALMEANDVSGARTVLFSPLKSGGEHKCNSCQEQLAEWMGRCPSCGRWGTIEQN